MYVLNGKVVLYPDGTGVDKQESDDVLYVQDVQTGELFTIAPNRISELAEATDPQAVIAEREEEIAAAMNQEIEQEEGAEGGTAVAVPTEAPEVRIPAPRFSGAHVTLDLPNGSSVNGVVLQETDDGVEVQTDSPVNGRFVQVFPTDEFDGMLSSVRDEADDVIWSREGAERKTEAVAAPQHGVAPQPEKVDNQGNPLNEDGTLKVEKISSIDELTDEDFSAPTRNVQLPALPQNVDNAIGANGKPVIIKRNIFVKNWDAHKFPFNESRNILKSALYNTDLVGQSQPSKKPFHWVAIKLDEKSPIVVLEVNERKDFTEIVGWYTLDERNYERIKRQAIRNGGELVMLSLKDKVESLSTPHDDLSSESKDTSSSRSLQGNEGENAANGQQREMQGNGIPVDAKTGEPVYDAVAPDVAWDAIVQEAEGDEAMAMQVVTDMVADMEAKVQKAKKAKKAKVRAGSTVREKLEAQKKHKRQIEEAEAQFEAWRRIAAVKAERIAAAERAKIEAAQQREVTQDDETEVPDFVFDKPENARERGYRMQNGQRADRQEPIAAAVGKEVSVKFTHKVSQPVRVAVVDARSLQPSHQNGQPNVLHFLPEAQPKKRTDHESVHAAEQMAAQMNPEEITSSVTAYTGAPSVNARGEVIQGNNRTAALKRMWQGYPEQAAAYKQYLMDHASEYGLNPEDIAAMEQPVLVNLMDVTDEQAIELGQYDVKDTESGGTERIKPRNVSQKMGDKAERFASILLRTTDEDASVSQLIDEHAVETLKWLEAQHYISPTQYRSAFNAEGEVTTEAKKDLRGILYQAVFKNGSERLEDMFNALPAKAQRAILATAYRDFATPESEKMLPEIQNSIVAFYELSQDAAFANAKNFEEARKATMAWLQQMQFDFSTGQSVSREGKYTNFVLTLAAMYKVQTQTAIQQTFNDMFDLLQGRQQPDLLFNPNPNNTPRTLAEAIREVLNIEYDGTNGSHALGGNNETRTTGRQGSARDDSAGGTDAQGNEAADAEGGTERDNGRIGTENEDRGNKEKENDETEVIGSSMTADEALDFIADMELGAEIAPEIDLTIENWDALFGKEGIVSTPIGNVKMGENQFTKLMRQGRNSKLGMIKPTLEHPHAIIADVSEAKEGDITERASSYVFIRSFKKVDGSRYYYFTSITVSKDGKEVVISNQEKRRNAIANLLTKGKLVWKHADDVSDASDMAQGLYSSQGNVSDLATEGTDAPQTTISSTGKDTPENSAVQTSGQENAETSLQSEVTRAEQQTNAEPTEGQKEAGNYKKGRVKVGPFDVVIEQPRGSVRSGVDANGKAWETTMQNTYGYFGGTKGVDGDAIDVFLGNDLDGWDGITVFVVDQYNPDGSFDEHKVMLGFNSQEEAEAAYFANYESDWAKTHRTEVTAVPLADFNEWVNSSKRKTKAFAEYKVAKRNAEIDAHNAQNEQLAEQLFSMAKEAETEKDFFDRAASLFEVTGYQFDLRDIYNGVKSGEIANARALSFYTNATLKPVKAGVKVKAPKSEQKQKAEAPRQSGYERKHWHADSSLEEMLAREKYLQNAMSFGTKEMAEVFPMAEEWQRDREELKAKYGDDLKNALPNDVKNAFLKKHRNTFANQTALNDELYELRSAIISHKEKAASRAEAAAKEQKAEEENKRFGDFLNGKTPLRKASIVKALTRVSNFGKEGSMTMAQFIEKHVADGTLELRTKEVDKLQGPSRRQLNRMDASQQAQAENRVKQAGKKTEYLINGFVANKTAYEYAEHLLATKKGKAGEKARKHAAQPGAPAVSMQEATLRDALVDVAQQSGLEVVVDEKAQQVLDEVNGKHKSVRMRMGDATETFKIRQKETADTRGVAMPGLNEVSVNVVQDIPKHSYRGNIKQATREAIDAAKKKYEGVVKTYNNYGAKFDYTISGNAIEICLSPKHQGKSVNKGVHLAMAEYLDEVINNSIEVEEHPDYIKVDGKRGNDSSVNENAIMHRFYGVAIIDGTPYRVMTLMREEKSFATSNGIHSYEVQKIEVLDNELPSTSNGVGSQNQIGSSYPLAKLLKDVEMSYRPGVKVLEESAKQRARLREHRVFHGSGAEFDAFDHSHMGEGEGAQAYGWGTYVTEVEGIGRAYARNPWQMKINELESNISRAKEKLPFMPPSATKTELENNIKEWEEELAKLENGNKHLYTVEIPEDNGTNYLHWEKPLTREQIGRITEKLKSGGWNVVDGNHPTFEKNGERIVLNERAQGQDVYAELEEALGSDKVASEFLASIGFTGISYPAEALSGGRKDAARNFVIFNEKDAQITDHIRFFRTPGGEAYGFTVDGKIYLDPRIATAETPIHEYAHLWADMIRNVNAEAWNDIVGLMKATPIWEEVRGLYPELKTDDEIADEVLAHYSGRRGAERLREAQQHAAAETGKSVFERAAAVAAIERVKQALAKFWQSVAELFHIRFTSAEEVADRVLADMLNGVNPNKVRNSSSVNVAEFAAKHHLNQNDVKKYADSMKSGSLGGASYAFKSIKRSVYLANEDMSLGQFVKVFKPIKNELFSNFGNVEELREEHVQEALNNRNVMEAARKREEAEKEAERKRLEVFEQMSDEALDKAYMEAVRNNDEQRMRDLVNEAARRKGYQSTDEFRMSHRAPSYDEDGTDKNLIDVANNKDNIRDSLEEQFRMNRDRNREESVAAISQAIQEIEQGKNPTVTIYRAVPKSLKEGSVRNGDWVTLSDAYAKQHGRHALNGDYRIMKENVPAANLYWDGNDINEWGYDDKRDYKYKDTRNNRKLNDLIVRDDKGAIIPLSKRFNTRKKDVRFQFVGQQGAAALDKAEEATTRLDNLGVAREMERQQKDAKAIKLATGWERGSDGKWRYEVQDFDVDVNGTARRNHLNERLPWGKEYDALLDKVFDGETLTEAENARLEELMSLSEELQNSYEELETRYLDDYVKDRSIFDAYPELKQVRVEMFNDPTSGVGATWYNESKLIRINEAKLENNSLQSLLAHEVQHAIQHIEGFAMGGNSTTYREHLAGFREKYEAWSVIDEFEDKSKELGDDARPIDVYNALVREYQSLGLEFGDGFAPSREAFDKGFNLWTRGYDNEGYEDAYNEYQRLMGKFGSGEYNNRYDQLAGEVEARNVQKRLHMTPEERRQSLAEETEDVAREDQFFIMENARGGNASQYSSSSMVSPLEMSDAEKYERGEWLRNAPAVDVESNQIVKTEHLSARKAAEKWWDEHTSSPLHYQTEIGDVVIDNNSIGNSLAHRYGQAKLDAITSLKEGFKNAVYLGSLQDFTRDGQVYNHYFAYPIQYNGERCYVFCRALHDANKNHLYVHEVFVASKIEKGNTLQTAASQPHGGIALYKDILANVLDAAKVVENPETSQGSAENNFREGKGELSDDMLSYLNDPMAQMMGKPRGTKKQRAQFAERERGRMQAHAEKLVERLHLTNVEIVTDASQLEGKQRTAKGFYNKRTGKITIVLPNHASTADVEQTLLHEAVAHYGLRQLFGEHFDDFLDMVYRNAEEGIRRKIAEASAKHGWNVRTATEEYLADLAERTDFEHASPQWWAKIKGFFLDMLRGLGFEAMDGQTLTDNELRYVLWRSYENLTEPGKYPTFIAEARDVAKQHALQVGRFAPTETVGSRVAENEALSEEEMSEILFRDGSTYNYTQVLARDRYERRIKSGMYQTQEALQDSMLGLRTAMESILEAEGRKGVYIEDIDGFENAYLGENRLSSVNQAEAEKFAREQFKVSSKKVCGCNIWVRQNVVASYVLAIGKR